MNNTILLNKNKDKVNKWYNVAWTVKTKTLTSLKYVNIVYKYFVRMKIMFVTVQLSN